MSVGLDFQNMFANYSSNIFVEDQLMIRHIFCNVVFCVQHTIATKAFVRVPHPFS